MCHVGRGVMSQENHERRVLEEKAEERRKQRAQQMNAKQLSLRKYPYFGGSIFLVASS